MDKWKDIELEKMKAGGNRKARQFFEDQPDWNDSMTIQQKYNTKAAALYRDKIATMAQGKSWDPSTSSAKNFSSSTVNNSQSTHTSVMSHSRSSGSIAMGGSGGGGGDYSNSDGGYQNGGGYQQFNTPEFKEQKDAFFNERQQQNAARPEFVISIFCVITPVFIFNIFIKYFFRNLHPNQGGKYAGFGSYSAPPPKSQSQEILDTTLSSLASVSIKFN